MEKTHFLPTIAVTNSYGFSLLFALLLLCAFFRIHFSHCISLHFFSRIGVVTIFSCSVSFLIVIEIFIILCLHYACNFQIWWQQSWVRFLFLLVSVLLRLLLYSFEHWKVIHHKWVADMENQSHNISKIYINCIESTIN